MSDQAQTAEAPFCWVWNDETLLIAEEAATSTDIRGFSANGNDKNGRPIVRCWNGKGEKMLVVLFRGKKLRVKFAAFMTGNLGITVDVKDGVSQKALKLRTYPQARA
jgi:hypothetical protein